MPKKRKNKKRKSTFSKSEEEKKENNKDKEIKDENDEEKNDTLKITNIEYEQFIKINEKLFEYILKYNPPIIIHNDKFNNEINLNSNSLIKIIKQSNLENEFKIYLTMQIITEKINYESYSSKNLSFNPKISNYLKEIKKYNITIPLSKTSISLDKKIIDKIFALMNMNNSDEIFNYIEFIVTQISYKYEKTQKSYMLKGAKNLKKIIEENKIFYFILKNNNVIIPLSNYSTKKIFNLINRGKDTKYLLINYKIKNEEFIEEEKNNFFLNKIINASDVKNILIKYKAQLNNNEVSILNNSKLNRIEEINITDLNNYLFQASQQLSNIMNIINNKKEEIINASENIINQYVLINIKGNNKFINKQYLELIKNKNMENISIYDYSKEKIFLLKKNLENIEEDNIYIGIIHDNKNYLVNKSNLLKKYNNWKIFNQKEIIDVIDDEFNNSEISIDLSNIKIKEQEEIKDIDDNLYLGDKNNLFDYVNNLPSKKVYNIKYKVKIKRIPKNKKLNN